MLPASTSSSKTSKESI